MAYYFEHDDNARRDPKIIRMIRKNGMASYGIYWALVEIIHEQSGILRASELPELAYDLRIEEELLLSVINDFDLFEVSGEEISNNRITESLEKRATKSKRARNSVNKRWAKTKNKDSIALPESKEEKENDYSVNVKFSNEALSDKSWRDPVCMQNKTIVNEKTFEKRMGEFLVQLTADKKIHANLSEFRRHFANWLRKQEPYRGGGKLQTTI